MPALPEDLERHFAQTYEESFPMMHDYAKKALSMMKPMDHASVLHDNACKTGIVAAAILNDAEASQHIKPTSIYATDPSAAMVDELKNKEILAGIQAEAMEMIELRFEDHTFTHSVTNFGLMTLTTDDAAVAAGQIYRTLRNGGTAVVTTWQQLGYMHMFQEVLEQVRPGARIPPNIPLPEHWMKEETLLEALTKDGFDRENIVVSQVSHEFTGDIWARPALDIIRGWIVMLITEGWRSEEREAFKAALEKRIQQEEAAPQNYTLFAHMALAQKQ